MTENKSVRSAMRAEAAAWLARLRADDRSVQDEIEFHAWLAQDSAHIAAFDEVTRVFDALGGMRDEIELPWRTDRRRLDRRAVLAGLGALTVAGASVALWRNAYAGVYETALGEQRSVTLGDKTQMLLDSETRIRISQTKTLRQATLEHGRANFRVAMDLARPFVVEAGVCQIVAPTAVFDVDRTEARLSVLMIEGKAHIQAGDAVDLARALPDSTLTSGERLALSRAEVSVDRPNPALLTAWQTGQAVFKNTLLADAIAELNRHSAIKLVIADPMIQNMRLSGVYRLGATEEFAESISALLPVSVRRDGERLLLRARDSRAS